MPPLSHVPPRRLWELKGPFSAPGCCRIAEAFSKMPVVTALPLVMHMKQRDEFSM